MGKGLVRNECALEPQTGLMTTSSIRQASASFAIHPNIPSPKDSPLRILWRRLGIMIMALIAPELIVTWAMRQWFSARRVTKQFKESEYFKISRPQGRPESHGPIEQCAENYVEGELNILFCTPITLAHDLPASQDSTRHLVVHLEEPTPRSSRALAKPLKKVFKAYVLEQYEDYTWTQTHSFFVLMGGFMLHVDGEPYLTLRPDYILTLIRDGCLDVAWIIMQLITRAIYHLETTQLETGTLAFAVLNFLTYTVWWNKPLDVQCPHPVYWKSTETKPKDHINDVDEGDEFAWLGTPALVVGPIVELIGSHVILTSRRLRVPTFDGSIKRTHSDKRVLQLAALLMTTIFGGIHCMAWFFAFPTYHERVLWRMSAIAITFTPCLFLLLVTLSFNSVAAVVTLQTVYGFIYFLSVTLYIIARAVLLVLMFTTLRNLPPDAYKAVSWTRYTLHICNDIQTAADILVVDGRARLRTGRDHMTCTFGMDANQTSFAHQSCSSNSHSQSTRRQLHLARIWTLTGMKFAAHLLIVVKWWVARTRTMKYAPNEAWKRSVIILCMERARALNNKQLLWSCEEDRSTISCMLEGSHAYI
ncbi:hypothetical protein BDR07DRAFT_1465403 [Suillus spraguei]|nr:hypothetical protein BDR07DRAFT_1465403 [Suillus spraguei]